MIKDLYINHNSKFTEVGCFVVFKREGKYYEVAVTMRHEYSVVDSNAERLKAYNDLMHHFLEECEKVNTHWKVSNKEKEDLSGYHIMEREIQL
jgi:hypothetical protein